MKKKSKTKTPGHKVVSQAAWLKARKTLLTKERKLTHQRDAVSAERRKLPWVKVDKNYVFEGPNGKESLVDLFRGRSQLVVYHFMFGPTWEEGCPSCSYLSDHYDGTLPHLRARDVSLAVVSRAPYAKIKAFQNRMGWKFPWLSSFGSDFNYDYQASFAPEDMAKGKVYYNYEVQQFPAEEAPGLSVFYQDKSGTVYHTYSSYARGLDLLVGTYNFLDLVPKGRDEDKLAFSMAWVRHHDRYDDNYAVDPKASYKVPVAR